MTKELLITNKLIRIRDTCRRFYGNEWKSKQSEWKPIIQAVMEKHKCDGVLNAAIILGELLEGFSLMTCLGVITEMLNSDDL